MTMTGENQTTWRKPVPVPPAHHKSHIGWPHIEPRPPWW